MIKTQKEALGFGENQFITIFKGKTYPHKDWFKENGARYTKFWGWSFSNEIPEELPIDLTAIRLDWDVVGNADGSLKPEDIIKTAIDNLLYDPDPSIFVGTVGDRLELDVQVERAIDIDGCYGHSTMHIMRATDGNIFVWTTAAKSWEENSIHHIRGTVKDHRIYRNTNQTILTRCCEVKKK